MHLRATVGAASGTFRLIKHNKQTKQNKQKKIIMIAGPFVASCGVARKHVK